MRQLRIALHDYCGHGAPIALARELARRGHSVRHFHFAEFQTPKGAFTIDDDIDLSFKAISLGRPFAKYSFLQRRFEDIAYGKRLAVELAAFSPNVVLSANTPLDAQRIILRQARAKGWHFSFWLQDILSVGIGAILRRRFGVAGAAVGRVYARLERRLLERSDSIVCISEDFLQVLNRWGISATSCRVIENWGAIDEIPLLPANPNWLQERGLGVGPMLLYSGTLGLKHDPRLILELARHLARTGEPPGATVVVASEGLGADWLRAQLGQAPLSNLHILPFQEPVAFVQMLAAADLFLATLESDAGVFCVPSKILSYLCAGRPTVLAAPEENLSSRILTRAGAGIVVGPTDRAGFAAATEQLLRDPDRRCAMGVAARQYAEREFNSYTIGSKFEQILLQGNPQRNNQRTGAAPIDKERQIDMRTSR